MRIVEFIDWLPPCHDGGDGILAAAYCRELTRLGHDILVLTCRKASRGASRQTDAAILRAVTLPEEYTAEAARAIAYADVFHAHQITNIEMLDLVSKTRDIPLVFHCHVDFVSYCADWTEPDFDVASYLHMQADMLSRASCVVCHSPRVKASVIDQGFQEGHVHVLEPIIDLKESRLGRAHARGPWTVAIGGRLDDPAKRFDASLRAFEIANRSLRGRLRLLIIGSVTENQAATARKRLGSNVEITGWLPGRDAVSRALSRASVFLSLSATESFGMMVLEALVLGVIPVCTGAGQVSAFIQAYQAGVLVGSVNRNDKEDLERLAADALIWLLEDPRRTRSLSRSCVLAGQQLRPYRSVAQLVEILRTYGRC
jgi:glycosyltransferase involved in cell wall biosynthesis